MSAAILLRRHAELAQQTREAEARLLLLERQPAPNEAWIDEQVRLLRLLETRLDEAELLLCRCGVEPRV